MIIQRIVPHGSLYRFFVSHIPETLEVKENAAGYGYEYVIQRKGEKSAWFRRPEAIARIYESYVEVFHPEFFSDIEKICKSYEEETQREITIRYWESV